MGQHRDHQEGRRPHHAGRRPVPRVSHAADAKAGTNWLTIDGVDSWTTDDQGKAIIASLRYSDFANNAQVASGEPGYNEYWLGEIKAPDG